MLVYFIGGVTYMEIAALRFLSAQKECEPPCLNPTLVCVPRFGVKPSGLASQRAGGM